jgi:hypothetical protein
LIYKSRVISLAGRTRVYCRKGRSNWEVENKVVSFEGRVRDRSDECWRFERAKRERKAVSVGV